MTKDNSIKISIVLLVLMVILSGAFTVIKLNDSTESPLDTVVKNVEVSLYRLESFQKDQLKAFDTVYTQLSKIPLKLQQGDRLKRMILDTYGFDASMRLIVDDGRYFNGVNSEDKTDVKSMENFFESTATSEDVLFEIEAFENQDSQLIGSISRRIVDPQSGKNAVLIKEVNFKDFILELKTIVRDGQSKIYLIDPQERFADLLGTSNSMLDVSGIKNLVANSPTKGIVKNQKINEETYTVIFKEMSSSHWNLVVLFKEKPLWNDRIFEVVAFVLLFVLSNAMLVLLYRKHVHGQFEQDQRMVVEDLYHAFDSEDYLPKWETDVMHRAKFSYRTLRQMMPFIRSGNADKQILTLAINALNLDPSLEPLELATRDNRIALNRELLNFVRAVCHLQNNEVDIEVEEEGFDFDISFEHLQMLMLIADYKEFMMHSGRILISGESAGKTVVLEFYGEMQRYLNELYKSILHQSEYYHLFSEISLLKLGHKLVLSPKLQTQEQLVYSSIHYEDRLPQKLYWLEDEFSDSTILKLMIKSLGVEIIALSEDQVVNVECIVGCDARLVDAYRLKYAQVGPKLLIFGTGDYEKGQQGLYINRPYQLHKVRYALTLLERQR